MPIYNVQVVFRTTMVVDAEDEADAEYVASRNARNDLYNNGVEPSVSVRGEITRVTQLRDGWDGECVPYGGNGNTRLCDLLKSDD